MFVLFNLDNSNNNSINLHVEEERIVLNEREHLLSDVKSRSDFRSYCKIVFPLKQTADQRTVSDNQGGNHSYPYSLDPFDLFTYTSESRYNQHEVSLFTHQSYEVAFIFFPHHTNFKDAILTILQPNDINVPYNVTTKNENGDIIPYLPDKTITEISGWGDYIYPKCTLELIGTTIVDGQTVHTIEFTYKDIDGTPKMSDFNAYIKTSIGYVSHRRLKVIAGKAQFKYIPLGLSTEEKADIQVGIGKYSYIAKLVV